MIPRPFHVNRITSSLVEYLFSEIVYRGARAHRNTKHLTLFNPQYDTLPANSHAFGLFLGICIILPHYSI